MDALWYLSVTASVICIIILVIRRLLKGKVSHKVIYGLWMILLIHLIVPIHLESDLSIFNIVSLPKTPPIEVLVDRVPNEDVSRMKLSNEPISKPINKLEENIVANMDQIKTNSTDNQWWLMMVNLDWLSIIWGGSVLTIGLILCILYIKNKRKFDEATIIILDEKLEERVSERMSYSRRLMVYQSIYAPTPLVFGIIHPKIILPSAMMHQCSNKDLEYVLCHELVHIKRFDYIIKLLSLTLLVLHWFNPILWMAYFAIQKDMELSCDEMVVNAYDGDIRKDYANCLINLASEQGKLRSTLVLAFGEQHIKSRIKSILRSKNKVKWISIFMIILLLPLSVVLLTDGKDIKNDETIQEVVEENDDAITYEDTEIPGKDQSDEVDPSVDKPSAYDETKGNLKFEVIDDYVKGVSYQEIRNTKAYQAVLDLGVEYVDELFEWRKILIDHKWKKGDIENARMKAGIEWLASEIIANRAQDPLAVKPIRNFTITNEQVKGYYEPNAESKVLVSIPKNTVIQLTRQYGMDWFMAKIVAPTDLIMDTYNENNFYHDHTEFWIAAESLDMNVIHIPKVYSTDSINTFDYLINNEVETIYNPMIQEEEQIVALKANPTGLSENIGYVASLDRVNLMKDLQNQIIKENGWLLVSSTHPNYSNADIGWIEEKYISVVSEKLVPHQGFIISPFMMYEHDNLTSSDDYLAFFHDFTNSQGVFVVDIIKSGKDYSYVSFGMNTFGGWIANEAIHYQLTDDLYQKIYWRQADFEKFIQVFNERLKEDHQSKVMAKDLQFVKVLSKNDKERIRNSLLSISGYENSEGGININELAEYPCYQLVIDDVTFTIAGDKVYLDMGKALRYQYGIGSEGAPILAIKPNREFLESIKSMVEVRENFGRDDYEYLFQASRISIYDLAHDEVYTFTDELDRLEALRQIQLAIGREVDIDKQSLGDVNYKVVFTYDDDQEIVMEVGDSFIKKNDKMYYYISDFQDIIASIFAG